MNDEQIIKAVAELDGWKLTTKSIPIWTCTSYDGSGEYIHKEVPIYENDGAFKMFENLLSYLTSRDAIVPVIEKQSELTQEKIYDELWLVWSKDNHIKDMATFCVWLIQASPRQLCLALLKTTGKI